MIVVSAILGLCLLVLLVIVSWGICDLIVEKILEE